jgi:hypothetical protein
MNLMEQGQRGVEHGGDIRQMGFDVALSALCNLFEMADDGGQGEDL